LLKIGCKIISSKQKPCKIDTYVERKRQRKWRGLMLKFPHDPSSYIENRRRHSKNQRRSEEQYGRKDQIKLLWVRGYNFISTLHFNHQLLLPTSNLTYVFCFLMFLCLFCSYNNNFSMFSMKVLSYGRERCVIMEAVVHDKYCVLANTLAAHFINSSDSSRAASLLNAAKSHLVSFNLSFISYKLLKCLIVIPFFNFPSS
jgi:hypothetical protein